MEGRKLSYLGGKPMVTGWSTFGERLVNVWSTSGERLVSRWGDDGKTLIPTRYRLTYVSDTDHMPTRIPT